jgi:GNAT superfamily N-acetyltransferase
MTRPERIRSSREDRGWLSEVGHGSIDIVVGQRGPSTYGTSGYYTIASGAVPFLNLPAPSARKLPRHPVPVILLARLAVDHSAQGQKLGESLLDALGRSLTLAEALGIHAVEVGAIDQQAKAFYQKYGFQPLLDAELHLYLPVATIRDACDRPSGRS